MGRPILGDKHFERAFIRDQFNSELLGQGLLQSLAIRATLVMFVPANKVPTDKEVVNGSKNEPRPTAVALWSGLASRPGRWIESRLREIWDGT